MTDWKKAHKWITARVSFTVFDHGFCVVKASFLSFLWSGQHSRIAVIDRDITTSTVSSSFIRSFLSLKKQMYPERRVEAGRREDAEALDNAEILRRDELSDAVFKYHGSVG